MGIPPPCLTGLFQAPLKNCKWNCVEHWNYDANDGNYYGCRMQTSEREGCGPEASPSVMPEASPESPPAPTKSPAFDLFNLVLSYKRLEIYLEPLKDAGDGVRYLLRYRLCRVALTCCIFCLLAM